MPAAGHDRRGPVLATIAGLRHRLLTAPELRAEVAAGSSSADSDGLDREQLAVAHREIERATRVPERLVQELAAAASTGVQSWQRARREKSFAVFAPALERIVALRREEAMIRAVGDHPYDGLLDEYEPGLRTARLTELFDRLGDRPGRHGRGGRRLRRRRRRERGARVVPVRGPARVRDLGRRADRLRLRSRAARSLDASVLHRSRPRRRALDLALQRRPTGAPACSASCTKRDTGSTSRACRSSGDAQPLGLVRSTSLHESQSRLWENQVGRHRGFWSFDRAALPRALPGRRQRRRGRAVARRQQGRARPDPRRRRRGHLHSAHPGALPARGGAHRRRARASPICRRRGTRATARCWESIRATTPRACCRTSTGRPASSATSRPTPSAASPARSCSPRRSASSAISAGGSRQGELDGLLRWLRENVHRHGCRYTADALLERATGSPLSPEPFLEYARGKVDALYGVTP